MDIVTVREGETLYKIARRFGMTPEKIASDNDIENPDALSVGQALLIVRPSKTHRAGKGDTVEHISAAYGIDPILIYQMNPELGGENVIPEGTDITLRASVPKIGSAVTNAYVNAETPVETLQAVLPYLSYVTVESAEVDAEGGIRVPMYDAVKSAKNYRTVSLLSVSNKTGGAYDESVLPAVCGSDGSRKSFASTIIGAAKENGYGGIEMDFRGDYPKYREEYHTLLREIKKEADRNDMTVMLSFPAETPAGDVEAAAQNADTVTLRMYSIPALSPEAVSPIWMTDKTLQSLAGTSLLRKTVCGYPLFGRNFTLPFQAGKSNMYTMSPEEAVSDAVKVSAAIQYDMSMGAPYYRYYAKEGERNTEHIVWFEDVRSMWEKIRQIDRRRAAGLSFYPAYGFHAPVYLLTASCFHIVKMPLCAFVNDVRPSFQKNN